MKMKLQQYVDNVESAKWERDDMGDAVMKLVEKGVSRVQIVNRLNSSASYAVKISNDYSEWPHSQIYLSSLAGMQFPFFYF